MIGSCTVHSDEKEWSTWNKRADPVLHIELRKWADVMVVAPLSANSLAKLATGLCDNLLTCVARAWDMKSKPLLVAPAMNTQMWNHPLTAHHLDTLQSWDYTVIQPVSKTLMCGDTGMGAMASVDAIVDAVVAATDATQLVAKGQRSGGRPRGRRGGKGRNSSKRYTEMGKSKTVCRNFIADGYCSHGQECKFAH
jgi:phosphopantothenoylcysteine decarboxylase